MNYIEEGMHINIKTKNESEFFDGVVTHIVIESGNQNGTDLECMIFIQETERTNQQFGIAAIYLRDVQELVVIE